MNNDKEKENSLNPGIKGKIILQSNSYDRIMAIYERV